MSIHRLRRHWEAHARNDPLWAVAAHPEARGGGWDPSAFFATGERVVAGLLADLEGHGLPRRRTLALDLGCGVGRLTQALAVRFAVAEGVDVSPTMVRLAEGYNRHGGRCRYRVIGVPPLPFPDRGFDLVCSFLTLQHIPPRLARRYLDDLGRLVGEGGALAVQHAAEPVVAGGRWGGLRRAYRMLPQATRAALARMLGRAGPFDMYGLPRSLVEARLERAGLRLLQVTPNREAGEGWTSFRYLAARLPE